ncbi:hypothetical protein O1L68_30310 [Streptomyces lydicus]|nr:hypothetical protein [Streptomyces lydicus]
MFEQLDQLTEPLQGMLGSPWLWLVILLVSGLDALLPFMPSETTVVLVAVLIGPDLPLLALLAGVAAAGALAGDCLGYAVGRYAGPRAVARLLRESAAGPGTPGPGHGSNGMPPCSSSPAASCPAAG